MKRQVSDFELAARMAMIKNGVSFKALSEKLEISSTYVQDIIKGTRPGSNYKEKIAQILEIEL